MSPKGEPARVLRGDVAAALRRDRDRPRESAGPRELPWMAMAFAGVALPRPCTASTGGCSSGPEPLDPPPFFFFFFFFFFFKKFRFPSARRPASRRRCRCRDTQSAGGRPTRHPQKTFASIAAQEASSRSRCRAWAIQVPVGSGQISSPDGAGDVHAGRGPAPGSPAPARRGCSPDGGSPGGSRAGQARASSALTLSSRRKSSANPMCRPQSRGHEVLLRIWANPKGATWLLAGIVTRSAAARQDHQRRSRRRRRRPSWYKQARGASAITAFRRASCSVGW